MQLTAPGQGNPNSWNLGWGNKNMKYAARNVLLSKQSLGQLSFGSVTSQSKRFNQFVDYLRNTHSIRDMRKITIDHVREYGQILAEKVMSGDLSASTAHDYMSAVNSVLSHATQSSKLVVTASQAGIPNRSHIATTSRATTQTQHQQVTSQLPERQAAIAEIQRELGLRFEEAAKANASQMHHQATTTGKVTIDAGTKGGRVREIEIRSQSQIDALQRASQIQGSHHSMIPSDQSYSKFQADSYKQYSQLGYQTHSERHSYAHSAYSHHIEQRTGVPGIQPPVAAGVEHGQRHEFLAQQLGTDVQTAKEADHYARGLVAQELGHSRINITNNYLG